ncbi:MAG: hypothetical protein CL678_10760 [Bdellovibrionaceae bacterium]|nr:hypothetical protein [Pseudobdellovibrionaceae bacterium]|tara:strand:- start:3400 stop:4383 length:984 start_codon:yes stop_codon:yes gene_type:complete
MRFESQFFLLLFLMIPFFHFLWKKRNQPVSVKFSLAIPKDIQKINPSKILLVLRYFSIGLLILGLMRPQSAHKSTQRKVSGVDIVLVMDVSRSMNVEDLADQSRIDVAKETIRKFIRGRQNDRIGLVIFSGEPLTLAPPTLDYGLVLQQLQSTTTGALKDGTAIGDGLALAVSRLKESQSKNRIIILLTDGDSNVGQIDPSTAGELAAGYGIKTYTIAIGREGRVRLPLIQKTPFGQSIKTYQWFENALNPELLKEIAEKTDGKFYRVTDAQALKQVFTEIDQLEKTEVNSKEKIKYDEKYQFPVKLGLIGLILEKILSLGVWRFVL